MSMSTIYIRVTADDLAGMIGTAQVSYMKSVATVPPFPEPRYERQTG